MPDGTPQEIAPPPAEPEPPAPATEAPAAPPAAPQESPEEPAAPAAPEPAPPAAEAAEAAAEPGALTEQLAAGDDAGEAAPEQPAPEAEAAPAQPPEPEDAANVQADQEAPAAEAPPEAAEAPRAAGKPRTAGRKPRNRAAKVLSLFALVLLISGVASVAVFMKQQVMIWFPATQRLYAMVGAGPAVLGRGLQIVEPKPTKEVDGNDQILVVEGKIRNISNAAVNIPLMRGALLDKQGKELSIWTFTAAKSRIKPGETAQYHTEFRNPPKNAESLDITFTRSDVPVATAKPAAAPQDATAAKPQSH
jgi:hypothetical protein